MNDTQPSFRRGEKVCRPADWIDVVKFFGFNYVLHALTVVPPPGANIFKTTVTSLFAILIPFTGVERAMSVLHRLVFLWGGGELGKALSAGALCMLVPADDGLNDGSAVRSEPFVALCRHVRSVLRLHRYHPQDHPQDGVSAVFDATLLEQISPLTTIVHGQYPADIQTLYTGRPGEDRVEDGPPRPGEDRVEDAPPRPRYMLVAVPPEFSAEPLLDIQSKQASLLRMLLDKVRGRQGAAGGSGPVAPALSCNYSFLKTIAALIQILYGSYELYMISGDQIRQYGYAAYQFTVIPYVTMSIVNLLAGLSTPSYPAMHTAHYRGIKKLEERGPSGDPGESVHGDAAMGVGRNYPSNWWTEYDRAKVEKMVGGAVGYVYGDFRDIGIAGRRVEPLDSDHFITHVARFVDFILYLLVLAVYATPYVVIQVLTGFGNGESTVVQRVFIMGWITFGQSSAVYYLTHHNDELGATIRRILINSRQSKVFTIGWAVLLGLFSSVAGFYTVSKMILNDRTCSRV